jgi:cytochrome b561
LSRKVRFGSVLSGWMKLNPSPKSTVDLTEAQKGLRMLGWMFGFIGFAMLFAVVYFVGHVPRSQRTNAWIVSGAGFTTGAIAAGVAVSRVVTRRRSGTQGRSSPWTLRVAVFSSSMAGVSLALLNTVPPFWMALISSVIAGMLSAGEVGYSRLWRVTKPED